MRAAVVLFALVATPFVVGAAQGKDPFSDPKNCGVHLSYSDRAGTRRPDAALVHGGKHGVMDRPCAAPTVPPVVEPPAPEPAPACAVTVQPNAGPWSIDGRVSDAAYPWPVLANWCIHVTGAGVSAIVKTDAAGNYMVSGLPDGDYTVCQDLPAGWVQWFPDAGAPCQSFPMWGYSVSFVNFRNLKQ